MKGVHYGWPTPFPVYDADDGILPPLVRQVFQQSRRKQAMQKHEEAATLFVARGLQ